MPARDGAPAPRVFLSGGPLKDVILTPEGYEKLKEEIEHLSTVKRREVADRIRVAREFGDIAENAEYDDAKNEQALLEYRIVGSAEADPAQNKLSNESPVGKAIIGKKKGETVEVVAPRGAMKFKI